MDSRMRASRNADMMEALFWQMLDHLQNQFPGFGPAVRYKGLPHRFKKTVYSIDSSTIALVANCMDWAKHRRRKAAAKLHLFLNLQTSLPSFAIIEEGSHHDSSRMLALCARLVAGEIAVFDKAYVHFKHLFSLTSRGVCWVTRAKDNMRCPLPCLQQAQGLGQYPARRRRSLSKPKAQKPITLAVRDGSLRGSKWTAKRSRWFSSPTIWNGPLRAFADSTKVAGRSKSSSNKSNRPCRSVTSWVTRSRPSAGSFGRRC